MEYQYFFYLMSAAVILGAGLSVVFAEKRYRRSLREKFKDVSVGDKYFRQSVPPGEHCEVVYEEVSVIYKFLDAGGRPWVTYEYTDECIPYDIPFEEFIVMFQKC